ncbi:LamB/YcsF family protein [Streptomyces lydicus]|nr:LamB/YcsF family protein [Streptomyces lydicus]
MSDPAPPPVIDLNADLGEGFGRWQLTDDEALLSVVTSANVACGFHAGDPATMRRVCELAAGRGVVIGAQVSYRDLAGFGRRAMEVPPEELSAEITYQIGALDVFARAAGTRVRYVKPHGALYNRCVHDAEQAAAVIDGIHAAGAALPVLGLPGSRLHEAARRAELPVVGEAFADRAYTDEGTLVPAANRARWSTTPTRSSSGPGHGPRPHRHLPRRPARRHHGPLAVPARRHPGAAGLARRVRSELAAAGVRIRSFV